MRNVFRRSICSGGLLGIVLGLTGCIESFEPKVASSAAGYLVVDGAINVQGVTTVRLSRTTPVNSKSKVPVESRASVAVETENGARYPLTETTPGTYTSAALQLPVGQRVRLAFKTASQQQYASEFTVAKLTPPLDSVTWRANRQGVQLYVSTHDETAAARYYRWEYEETWAFISAFYSLIELKNGVIGIRQEDIYHCWGNEKPTSIALGNTSRLSEDKVSAAPLALVLSTSPKLRIKYSVLVKQYALSQAEYDYWELLRKNTETLGTLFDPLPSQLSGNIHNVADTKEVVIGFVGAQTMTQRRLFIDSGQLPRDWRQPTDYDKCVLDTLPRTKGGPKLEIKPQEFFRSNEYLPVGYFYLPGSSKEYILYSSADCVDCRRRGTNIKPSFWQ